MPPRRFSFDNAVRALRATPRGEERNMYPYLRDLLVHTLRHPANSIKVDTRIASGGVPDLWLDVTGAGRPTLSRWLIVEAKDEPGAFASEATRAAIFADKRKYLSLDTAWFVMVDPTTLVVRPITLGQRVYAPSGDIVLALDGLTEAEFLARCGGLVRPAEGEHARLAAFRDGATDHVATVPLRGDDARAMFFDALRRSIALLQEGVTHALAAWDQPVADARRHTRAFDTAYGGSDMTFTPFTVRGRAVPRELVAQHRADVRALRQEFRRDPVAFRLAAETLPAFERRAAGKTPAERAQNARLGLVAETAGLMLARVLMLRFFEDHAFLQGERRYLCNGGISAFRLMREYFGKKYPALLKDAYHEGARIYEAVFGETYLDWVLDSDDELMSRDLETVMLYLSYFDFRTITEDLLSGIYGQFLDPAQRKKLGEHYTPPSVAGYVVERVGLRAGQSLFDPACGLGTFLIEGYRVLSDGIRRGGGTYADVVATLGQVRGNDLNFFSATLAQMQVLWHILAYREEIRARGLPHLALTGGYNSLRAGDLFTELDEFSDLDYAQHDVVVGNPPYVRPERQGQPMSPDEAAFYEEVSANIDLYSLFIYKALTRWVVPDGRVGFVVPLSFCDNKDNGRLRALFAPGGRWSIREIVDMEEISEEVFPDGDVATIVLILQNTPPGPDDRITLRVAGRECVEGIGGERGEVLFDLRRAPAVDMPYADVFTADGRIMTRITPKRRPLIERLAAFPTFNDIARRYWVRRDRSALVEAALEPPEGAARARWAERRMLTEGGAFRGERPERPGGMTVYKGENIEACRITGEPQAVDIDAARMDGPSLWRFPHVLPETVYAFQIINPLLTCTPFDPRGVLFLNTAVLFAPRDDLAAVPFDFLVLSRVYQFYFAVSQREGVLFRTRAHVYPRTVARLPWSDAITPHAAALHDLRTQFLALSREASDRRAAARERVAALAVETLRERVARLPALRLRWAEDGQAAAVTPGSTERWWTVQYADDLFGAVFVNDAETAALLECVLPLYDGETLDKDKVLAIRLPRTPDAEAALAAVVADWKSRDPLAARSAVLDQLDAIVGAAFALSAAEIALVQAEMASDPFLSRLRASMPFARVRFHGFREGLDQADRFTRVGGAGAAAAGD